MDAVPAGQFCQAPSPADFDDYDLVVRIIAAYRKAIETPIGAGAMWDGPLFEMKLDVHHALVSGDVDLVQRLLRDPRETDLFFGFDELSKTLIPLPINTQSMAARLSGMLRNLCEAVGVVRIKNPEAAPSPDPSIEGLLSSLDDAFAFRVEFPNPFEGQRGIATSRGVASDRAIQGLYQAARAVSLAGFQANMLEIGAGLGLTAYYARMFGVEDYTIIDLPMTSVAHGYFLGRALGPEAICLYGEDRLGIRIWPPDSFLGGAERYELVVNVDSLTEMSREVATSYCAMAKSRADTFLSINHEANTFTSREIFSGLGLTAESRTPYWLRLGYADEVFRMR